MSRKMQAKSQRTRRSTYQSSQQSVLKQPMYPPSLFHVRSRIAEKQTHRVEHRGDRSSQKLKQKIRAKKYVIIMKRVIVNIIYCLGFHTLNRMLLRIGSLLKMSSSNAEVKTGLKNPAQAPFNIYIYTLDCLFISCQKNSLKN